jgi:maleate isomerase
MTRNDNWGWKARIGMFIVGVEVVAEAEWWAMLPPSVSVHAARVTSATPWAQWNASRTAVELADDLIRGARQFAAMRLSAIVIGHSSSSIVGGEGWDEAVVTQLVGMLDPTVKVTTNGLDSLAALRAAGIKRPFLVFPAWFNDELIAAGIRYYEAYGVRPAGHMRHDPGRKWRELPPEQLYPEGITVEQEVASLYRQVKHNCPDTADGVYLPGTGFRCVAIIEDLERDLRRPVLSANQVSLWHCLRLSGIHTPVAGYGALLATERAGA